ncbi:phosphotransferase enzyme family protein [Nocardioides euryhalodurans]|uniref:phosphotransferase enzyme family protein n=1 Tax=Nocardioides euryhalodurans TaxID=2518370 RepID=UPI0014246030|nr:phosphotransferase [Nocardioides euryhalodurans]
MDYRDLPEDQQVAALRTAAATAAERFGLEVTGLEVAAHAFNTTFAVDTKEGERVALRVNTGSQSGPENVVAQQEWQRGIAAETDVLVPVPLLTPDGAWSVEVASEAYGGPLLVTGASWLEGPDVDEPDAEVARELGRAMARLHLQAEAWSLPDGAAMPVFDTPLFGDEDLLASAEGLDDDGRAVLDRAREVADEGFGALFDGASLRPLHADLHGGNLKWHAGRLAVFDFDDCGLGLPELDLAISAFYLRDVDPAPEQAMWEGYADVTPPPVVDPAHFEAMVASRQLLLANSLLASSNAELRGEAEDYLGVSVRRLARWLATGTFTRAAPS